jgi:hypothetical protein
MISSEEESDSNNDELNKQMVRMTGPDGKEMVVSVKLPG